jgi:hypothetical protein
MHKFWLLSRFIVPALVIASFVGHLKGGGASIYGFSSGN